MRAIIDFSIPIRKIRNGCQTLPFLIMSFFGGYGEIYLRSSVAFGGETLQVVKLFGSQMPRHSRSATRRKRRERP
jgi:hypothetical protein